MATAYYAVPLVQWKFLLEQSKRVSAEEVEILPEKNFNLVLAPTRQEAALAACLRLVRLGRQLKEIDFAMLILTVQPEALGHPFEVRADHLSCLGLHFGVQEEKFDNAFLGLQKAKKWTCEVVMEKLTTSSSLVWESSPPVTQAMWPLYIVLQNGHLERSWSCDSLVANDSMTQYMMQYMNLPRRVKIGLDPAADLFVFKSMRDACVLAGLQSHDCKKKHVILEIFLDPSMVPLPEQAGLVLTSFSTEYLDFFLAKNNNPVVEVSQTHVAQDLARLAAFCRVHSAEWDLKIEGAKTTMEIALAPSLAERAKNKTKALQDEVVRLGNELADAKDRLTRHEAAQQSQAPDAKRPRVA